METAGRFELPNRGFADPCLTAWLRCQKRNASGKRRSSGRRANPRQTAEAEMTCRTFREVAVSEGEAPQPQNRVGLQHVE